MTASVRSRNALGSTISGAAAVLAFIVSAQRLG